MDDVASELDAVVAADRAGLGRNVIHGSDAVDSAKHEIGLWFPEGVSEYAHTAHAWIYE